VRNPLIAAAISVALAPAEGSRGAAFEKDASERRPEAAGFRSGRFIAACVAQYLSTPPRDQFVIDRNSANATELVRQPVAGDQFALPYPQLTGVNEQQKNDGSSYFHGLTMRLEKRFSQGLQFLTNYQFARTIEKVSRLNNFDGPDETGARRDHRSRPCFNAFNHGTLAGPNLGPTLSAFVTITGVNNLERHLQMGPPYGVVGLDRF